MESAATVTQLLLRWSQGDQAALDELAPRVQLELHSLATAHFKRWHRKGWRPPKTLQATALINETWLRWIGKPPRIQWENRAQFFRFANHLMHLILVDYQRKHRAKKRGGALESVSLEQANLLSPGRALEILVINEALDQLAKLDERKAKVIRLRYFGRLRREEIAAELDISLATVKNDLQFGEAWLWRFLAEERKPVETARHQGGSRPSSKERTPQSSPQK